MHKHSIITFVLAILYHMNKVGVDECDTASYADIFLTTLVNIFLLVLF